MTPHPAPRRDDTGRVLASRQLVAYATHRHIDTVRRAVPPVACDVTTRAALLDLDHAEITLSSRTRRRALTSPSA